MICDAVLENLVWYFMSAQGGETNDWCNLAAFVSLSVWSAPSLRMSVVHLSGLPLLSGYTST